MNIKTEIGKNTIKFSWGGKVEGFFGGNALLIEYDVDISKTPKHLANFMFGLIMADPLSWNLGTITFDEMTNRELEGIRNILIMNFHSKGCGGVAAHSFDAFYPSRLKVKVEAENIVNEERGEGDGPVLCANGLGKDGLLVANLVKELGVDLRCFFVEGQMTPSVNRKMMRNINRFYEERKIKSNIIKANFCADRIPLQGFYPYFFGLPLSHHYQSEITLLGTSLHMNKTRKTDLALHCPMETIFAFDYASKASGIRFSSPHTPLSLPAVQQLLTERYGDSLKYQRSCINRSPWCNKCGKCNRHHLYISTAGVDPATLGLNIPRAKDGYRGATGTQSKYGQEVLSCINKMEGKPYEKWVFGANKLALDLIWKGGELEKIFQEHFDLYSYDIDPYKGEWVILPSKWREWMDTDFVKVLDKTRERPQNEVRY